eukprot:1346149-Amphidinium_carterae.1
MSHTRVTAMLMALLTSSGLSVNFRTFKAQTASRNKLSQAASNLQGACSLPPGKPYLRFLGQSPRPHLQNQGRICLSPQCPCLAAPSTCNKQGVAALTAIIMRSASETDSPLWRKLQEALAPEWKLQFSFHADGAGHLRLIGTCSTISAGVVMFPDKGYNGLRSWVRLPAQCCAECRC